MYAALAEQLTRYRKRNAIISLLCLFAFLIGCKNLYFETSYRIFFDSDNPQLIEHDEIESTYSKSDNVMFAFEFSDNKVFTRENLQLLIEFTEEAWQMPYSSRVDSVTNYQYTWGNEDDLLVEELVEDLSVLSDQDLLERERLAKEEPQLKNLLLSEQGHTAAVMVTLHLPDDQLEADKATAEVSAWAKKKAAIYENKSDNLIKIHLTGETMVNATFIEMAQKDLQTLFPIMYLFIVILLVAMLRSFYGMLVTLIVIMVSVGSAMGFAGWTGYALNQVNVVCPVIVLTLAVCDCIHILNAFFLYLQKGMSKNDAVEKALEVNFKPIFLTSITTAIGFLSMNFSDSPPFWGLGNISAFGVMAAFVFSFTLLPSLLMWLPFVPKESFSKQSGLVTKLGDRVLASKTPLFYGMLVIAGVLIACMTKNELNDNTVAYFHQDVPFRQAADFTQANLTGFDQIAYSLKSGESNGASDPAFLRKVDAFVHWLSAQPEIVQVSSYTHVHKRLNKNMHSDEQSFYKLPDQRELSAQYLLLYELSLPFGLDLNNQIDLDKSSLLVRTRVKDQKANQLVALDERAQAWLKDNHPELLTHGASVSLMFAHIGQRNISSMIFGSVMALALVTLTLIISLKSLKYGLISLIPNAFPAGIAFGLWAILDGEVNLAVAVIFAVTLGIVVDDTVHFISKYLTGVRDKGLNADEAVKFAFEHVGNALFITTVVLASGFFILATSSFDVNAVLGFLVGLTVVVALVWDFLFLPVLLAKVDSKSGR